MNNIIASAASLYIYTALIVNILENGLLKKMLTPRFELGLAALFHNRPTFTKNPYLFFLLILSRGAGVPFPVMSTFLYCFKEHLRIFEGTRTLDLVTVFKEVYYMVFRLI